MKRLLVGLVFFTIALGVPRTVVFADPEGPPSAKFIYDAAGRLIQVVNLRSDPANCGAIGQSCAAIPGATACCSAGRCGFLEYGICMEGRPVTVAVAPSAATVEAGTAQQFTAVVTNATDQTVLWYVNDVAGGNSTLGTISDSGVYAAPAGAQSSLSVSIHAVAMADFAALGLADVTVVPRAVVTLTPSTASVAAGGSQQFAAAVVGGAGGGVQWVVNGVQGGNAVIGTVTGTGLYTAPAGVPTPATVQVTAAVTGGGGSSATASVTVTAAAVSVAISPLVASVVTGKTQRVVASVRNAAASTVTWKVNGITGGNSTVGTITTSGLYTAPTAVTIPTVFSVSATSTSDPGKSATSALTVVPPTIAVSVAPATLAIRTTQTQQFSAMVSGTTTTAVTWRVNGIAGGNSTVGTIGASGLYTAPVTLPSPASVTVSATSTVDTTKSGTASISLTTSTAVLVSVNPTAAPVAPGASQQFAATVQNTTTKTVSWKVNGTTGGNSTVGTISTAGLYRAPSSVPSPATVTITGVSTVDSTKSGTASATVAKAVAVTVSPTSATVASGAAKQITATVSNVGNTNVTWMVNGMAGGNDVVGTVSPAGLYQAPSFVPAPAGIAVAAISAADLSKSATSNMTITAPQVSVGLSPPSASLRAGQSAQFTASVRGSGNTSVTWKVNGVVGGSASKGTITASGLYTAPASVSGPTTATVSAVSVADSTKSASVMVALDVASAVMVAVSPSAAKLQLGGQLQFGAAVTNSSNQGVTWQVNGVAGGDASVGTVSPSGFYVAPATLPGVSITVSAVAQADGAATDSAAVTLLSGAPVSVSLAPRKLVVLGYGTGVVATVTNTTDTSVSWYVNGIRDGSDAVGYAGGGTYRAPAVWPGDPVVVTAVSNADPTKWDSVPVEYVPFPAMGIWLAPTDQTVRAGRTIAFRASTLGVPWADLGVSWEVNNIPGGYPAIGTIADGTYTAPAVPPAGPVKVTARLAAYPSYASSTSVTVVPAAPVSIEPAAAEVQAGNGIVMKAYVIGLASPGFSWSVNGIAGGDATYGTIDAGGLYRAPTTVPLNPLVVIAATSTADPSKTGEASLRILATPPVAVVYPQDPYMVEVGEAAWLRASVVGAADTRLTYKVNGQIGGSAQSGTISADGYFIAPAAVPSPSTVIVSAELSADPTRSASRVVTIIPKKPTLLYLFGLPSQCPPLDVFVSTSRSLTAVIDGSLDNRVVWQVDGYTGGDGLRGRIDSLGGFQATFQAPAAVPSPSVVTVIVSQASDPSVRYGVQLNIVQ
jgi:hypothetical protein